MNYISFEEVITPNRQVFDYSKDHTEMLDIIREQSRLIEEYRDRIQELTDQNFQQWRKLKQCKCQKRKTQVNFMSIQSCEVQIPGMKEEQDQDDSNKKNFESKGNKKIETEPDYKSTADRSFLPSPKRTHRRRRVIIDEESVISDGRSLKLMGSERSFCKSPLTDYLQPESFLSSKDITYTFNELQTSSGKKQSSILSFQQLPSDCKVEQVPCVSVKLACPTAASKGAKSRVKSKREMELHFLLDELNQISNPSSPSSQWSKPNMELQDNERVTLRDYTSMTTNFQRSKSSLM
ncbi:unnamed protein product [Moneuplotes crassus]|uniref:Uncharacterized protein n=1 Tax=Euplotes crassus TaxID=5936 RepID=A0AAD1XQY3_EUPCR|nr:unnamed protein product [Moneuplotes crassus]